MLAYFEPYPACKVALRIPAHELFMMEEAVSE